MRYHAQALAANGVDVDLVGLEGTPLPRAITDEPRITVHRLAPPRLRIRGELTGSTLRRRRPARCGARQLPAVADAERPAAAGPGARPEPAGLSDARGHLVLAARPRRALRHRLAQPRLHAAAAAARATGIRRCGWRAGSSAAMRGASDANLCVSRGLAAFLESRFGVKQAQRALRPAGVGVRADRARRSRAVPPGAVRAPRHPRQHRRLHRLSRRAGPRTRTSTSSIEAVMRLEERIRGWEAGNSARRFPELVILVTGDGARRAEFERRFAGPAGAADSAARALPRARRLPAGRRQRRSRALPAPLLVRARHPDEDRRSVRRRRAGLRARLRRVPRRARAARRQRPAVLDRPAAGRRAVRSVRDSSRPIRRRSIGCAPARASWRGRRGKKAGCAKPSRCCCRTHRQP